MGHADWAPTSAGTAGRCTVKICRQKFRRHFHLSKMTTNRCQLTKRSSFVTTGSPPRFQFSMPITGATTVSSSGSDDNVVIKISHGIVVKMTTKIFTVWCTPPLTFSPLPSPPFSFLPISGSGLQGRVKGRPGIGPGI